MPGTTSTSKKAAPAKAAKASAKRSAAETVADDELAVTSTDNGAAESGGEGPNGTHPTVAAATATKEPHPGAATSDGGHAARGQATAKRAAEGYTDEKFLASQRAALAEERSTYLEQAQSLRAEADSLVEEMEPGDIQFDEESGEGGTVTVDRERDLALSAQALAAVEEIDHAEAKIEIGTYGICESCGTLIPKARLEALPFARLCIACKSGGLSRR